MNRLSHDADPIAALATASGRSGVAMIRVSGQDCIRIVLNCLSPNKNIDELAMRHVYYADYIGHDQQIIDDVTVVFFGNPASYTGQDSVEICCHGSMYIVQKILSDLKLRGVRHALGGEFTKRALLSGRIDLLKAEGIKYLVEASTEQELRAGRSLLSGKLSLAIMQLRAEIIESLAFLEARIDFPDEEETSHVPLEAVFKRVKKVDASIDQLLSTFKSGSVQANGLKVALFGPPNAGKSTLMNTLLERERAIVSDIPGTTRDYIQETVLMDGRLIHLIDLAGVRETLDQIEKIGVKKAYEIAQDVDLLLVLIPIDYSDDKKEVILNQLKSLDLKEYLIVRTKADVDSSQKTEYLNISCHTGAGLNELRQIMTAKVDFHMSHIKDEVFIATQRQHLALSAAKESLKKFWTTSHQDDECLAFELQSVAKELLAVIGEVSQDDILDKIFREFCVGK